MKNFFPKSFDYYVSEFFKMLGWLCIIFLIRTFVFGLYQVPTGSMEPTLLVGESLLSDKLSVWFMPIKRGEVIAFNQPTYEYSDHPAMGIFQKYFLGIFWGPQNWTKRVIAIPGDRIQGKIEDDKTVLYLNGERLNEPYVNSYPLAIEKQMVYSDMGCGFGYAEHRFTYDPSVSYANQPFYKISEKRDMVTSAQGKLKLIQPGTPLSDGRDIFDVKLRDNEYWVMGDNREGSSDSRYCGPIDGSLIHGRVVFRILSFDDPDTSWMAISFLKKPITFWKKIRWNRLFQIIR